jgi:hypothetical protein
MTTNHIPEIRAWAKAQSNGDSKNALVARRMLVLIKRIDELDDDNHEEELRLAHALADLAFDVAMAHGQTPWEFFAGRTREGERQCLTVAM